MLQAWQAAVVASSLAGGATAAPQRAKGSAGHLAISPVSVSDDAAGWYGLGAIGGEYFQALSFGASKLRGTVSYHAAFDVSAHGNRDGTTVGK